MQGLVAGRAQRSVLMLVVGSLAACTSPGASEKYVVEVQGSRKALEAYTLQADGARDEGIYFAYDKFFRRLTLDAPGGLLAHPPVAFQIRKNDQMLETVVLQPFVCQTQSARHTQLFERGWHMVERHQVLLTDEGQLKLHTDLERQLSYSCEATASSGEEGEGWSSPLGTEGTCDEPERAATQMTLEIEGSLHQPRLCHATYLQRDGGLIHLGFSFPIPGSLPLTVSLWHCMEPSTASYPLMLTAGQHFPQPNCPRQPGASRTTEAGSISAPLLRGSWRIDHIYFVDGGHLMGEVDAVFGVPGGSGELRLNGPVDLPLLRIPFQAGTTP
jgi:hypothetical protein